MKILAIETSCDETAIAIIETYKNGSFKILSNLVASQIKIHKLFGGVVPILAKREHQKNLIPLFLKSLKESDLLNSKFKILNSKQIQTAKFKKIQFILEREPDLLKNFQKNILPLKKPEIDLIAVTSGPGLEPALWTGVNFARALSYWFNIPLIEVNHIEGHIASNWFKPIGEISKSKFLTSKQTFPAICLVVSGGHTILILMKGFLKYKILGETLDDAAGEAFDKVAKMLNLAYPGGPIVAKMATKFKIQNSKSKIILPRPMINSKNFNFSFSGLKTAVLYKIRDLKKEKQNIKKLIPLICKEFQQAVIDVLISKTLKAAKLYKTKSIMISGGVSSNKELRNQFKKQIRKNLPNTLYFIPETKYCTDNALMIGITAYFKYKKFGKKILKNWKNLKVDANLKLK